MIDFAHTNAKGNQGAASKGNEGHATGGAGAVRNDEIHTNADGYHGHNVHERVACVGCCVRVY